MKKPASSPSASGTPNAEREERRHSRKRVLIPATVEGAPEGKSSAVIVGISRSGLEVMVSPGLEVSRLQLQFTLPETDVLVRATGDVRWRDGTGRMGVRVVAIDCKPRDWHGWFEKVKTPARPGTETSAATLLERVLGQTMPDWHEPEAHDSKPELIASLRDNLHEPVASRSSYRSLRWLGVGILAMAVCAGIIVRGRPVLRAFLSARYADSKVTAQNLPSRNASGNRERAKTEITIVEGLPVLAKPLHSDQAPAKIIRGRLAHSTDLSFPEAALNSGIAGDVKATLMISEEGSVEQVDILQGDDRLADAVATTLGHWRYPPFKVDGRPVAVKLPITVTFALRQSGSGSNPRR